MLIIYLLYIMSHTSRMQDIKEQVLFLSHSITYIFFHHRKLCLTYSRCSANTVHLWISTITFSALCLACFVYMGQNWSKELLQPFLRKPICLQILFLLCHFSWLTIWKYSPYSVAPQHCKSAYMINFESKFYINIVHSTDWIFDITIFRCDNSIMVWLFLSMKNTCLLEILTGLFIFEIIWWLRFASK